VKVGKSGRFWRYLTFLWLLFVPVLPAVAQQLPEVAQTSNPLVDIDSVDMATGRLVCISRCYRILPSGAS
jgi:hypothetical protein